MEDKIRLLKYKKVGKTKEVCSDGSVKNIVYDCRLKLDDKNKIILWIDCDCWNFQNRRIKKVGKVQDIVFMAEPCKHLEPVVKVLLLQGYKFKENNKSVGLDKCTPKLRKTILEIYKNTCAVEGCEETTGLEIHRRLPGVNGGKYSISNCEPLCKKHHQLITFQRYRDLK